MRHKVRLTFLYSSKYLVTTHNTWSSSVLYPLLFPKMERMYMKRLTMSR